MKNQGYITLSRNIVNHWLWQDNRKFSKFEAWFDLIVRAQYTEKQKVLVKDGRKLLPVETERGTVNCSLRSLSADWGWTVKTTERYLNLLQEGQQIVLQKIGKHSRLIKLVNYNKYNPLPKKEKNKNDTDTTTHTTTHTTTSYVIQEKKVNNREVFFQKNNDEDKRSPDEIAETSRKIKLAISKMGAGRKEPINEDVE